MMRVSLFIPPSPSAYEMNHLDLVAFTERKPGIVRAPDHRAVHLDRDATGGQTDRFQQTEHRGPLGGLALLPIKDDRHGETSRHPDHLPEAFCAAFLISCLISAVS